MKKKQSSQHHLLLTVAGMTPATVTEALWGLGVGRGIAVNELRVLTTRNGARQIAQPLAASIAQLCQDYPQPFAQLPPFDPARDLYICEDASGDELDDIRNEGDNQAVADWILRQVARACAGEQTVVHASIAGGRKTMSFFLGTALQLLGRPQDRLYHVLVSPEHEVPGFAYPTPLSRKIKTRDGAIDARDAQVDMAEIPYVPLRGLLGDSPLTRLVEKATFSELVGRAGNALGKPTLEVHVHWQRTKERSRPRIEFCEPDQEQPLVTLEYQKVDSLEFAIYTYLLRKRQEDAELGYADEPRPIPINRDELFPETLIDLRRWVKRLAQGDGAFDDANSPLLTTLKDSMERIREGEDSISEIRLGWYKADLGPRMSKFTKELAQKFAIGARAHHPGHYQVQGIGGKRPSARDKGHWHLAVPPDSIFFHPEIE